MAIDRWFIGGGAEHTPESARRLVYATTGGAEGVGGVKDLEVVPLETPGQGVRVLIGSALILSRYVGGETQTYMGTVYEQESVPITPTGSGAARSDLVVLRVEDPFAAGSSYEEPSEIATAPYVHVRVISGVPANTTRLQDVPGHQNDTGIALARIDLPPSTGTVDNITGKIVDLRQVAQPRQELHTRNYEMVSGETSAITATTAYPQGATWPAHAEVDATWAEIDIPSWATKMRIVMTWNGVLIPGGAARGWVWVQVGLNVNPDRVVTQGRLWNTEREGYRATGTLNVPESMRGTKQGFFPRATRLAGTNQTAPVLDASSGLDLLVEFFETAS